MEHGIAAGGRVRSLRLHIDVALHGLVFSERRERFEKYLTMEGLAPPEISEWREGFEFFLRKLSFKYGRPLVLKSAAA
jgi:hypothetical protein